MPTTSPAVMTDIAIHGTVIPNELSQVVDPGFDVPPARDPFPGRLEFERDDGGALTVHIFAAGASGAALSLEIDDEQGALLRSACALPTSDDPLDRISHARELIHRGVALIDEAHIEAAGGDAWEGWTEDARRLLMLTQRLQARVVPQVINEAMGKGLS